MKNSEAHIEKSSSAVVHPRYLPLPRSSSTLPSSFSVLIHNATFPFVNTHLHHRLPPPRHRSSASTSPFIHAENLPKVWMGF
ncbi:uncharacterized protein DS421_12g371650 [Arachis hypogaea]|nr:uncharacterized protein DS421_12g371650 [Arachis hypogaea]